MGKKGKRKHMYSGTKHCYNGNLDAMIPPIWKKPKIIHPIQLILDDMMMQKSHSNDNCQEDKDQGDCDDNDFGIEPTVRFPNVNEKELTPFFRPHTLMQYFGNNRLLKSRVKNFSFRSKDFFSK